MPDQAAADPRRVIAQLRRKLARRDTELARRTAERDAALAREAASAGIIGAINASPGDLVPVFEAILEKAHTLCGAIKGSLVTLDGGQFRTVATRGLSEPYTALLSQTRHDAPGSVPDRLRQGESIVQLLDARDCEFPVARAAAELEGARTILYVPLKKDTALLGYITAYRQEVRAFSDKQITLLQNFAAQAVVAMENARLITETREALEQQTATAEVLGVINSSPGDLAPVFDAILEKAHNFCGAVDGTLFLYEENRLRAAAMRNVPEPMAERLREGMPADAPMCAPLLAGERFVHIPDLGLLDHPTAQAGVKLSGTRTLLSIPLRKGVDLLGIIVGVRKEVRPFSDKEIALLENFGAQAVIAMENARLITETREALQQQTATAEVLGVINSSPGDLTPVFDAMLEKALRLCDAAFGNLWTYDGTVARLAATWGASPEYRAELVRMGPQKPENGGALMRLVAGEPLLHIADITAEGAHRSGVAVRRMLADRAGARTVLWVPMRKDSAFLGFFTIYRTEVRPFTDKQIALLQNFAAQAVIAMENARLITETREALEQQTATAEVLGVINASPGDLAPVFDAILEKARRLCGAVQGALRTFDGEAFHLVAADGVQVDRLKELGAIRLADIAPGDAFDLLARGERVVHIPDWRETDAYRDDPMARERIDRRGLRSWLGVTLRKDETLLGTITVSRQEVRPFSAREIALLENFAAQAVIAMENARLITETREALEQQTATAEVLGVINASPGDLAPVFDAMLEKALQLCGAAFGTLWTYSDEGFRAAALRRVPSDYAAFLSRAPMRPVSPTSGLGRFIAGGGLFHSADMAAEPEYQQNIPGIRAAVDLGGVRSVVGIPLRKDATLLGAITIYRQEVRPFTDKQIALLQNFAAQAVIAMENARLITETREALEQQTATAEVLQVINASPGDLAPVFDAILEKAHQLCGVTYGTLQLRDGDKFRTVTTRGYSQALVERLRQGFSPTPNHPMRRLFDGEPYVHIADLAEVDDPAAKYVAQLAAIRTSLFVALRKEDALLGFITAARDELRPFSEKQIALLQNFAAQAVIAMENARLLGELRARTHDLEESLEYQTATSDVLQVISRSTFDLQPVLDTVVETATRLCLADQAVIFRREADDSYALVANFGFPPEYEAFQRERGRVPAALRAGSPATLARAARERTVIHYEDVAAVQGYPEAPIALGKQRTSLGVPLLREGEPIGVLALARQRVEPFTERQIELVRTFADQAVIAIENARLITETREALQQQTATAEVLGVINASPGDLAPVFDAILDKAHTLCEADFGALLTYDGERFRPVASSGASARFAEAMRGGIRPSPRNSFGQVMQGDRFVHIHDMREIADQLDDPVPRALADSGEIRTQLMVPLRKDDRVLGVITANRREVRPFTDQQIALLQNFAAQAVIAMENARLITETREALEQQTATAEVLGVINSSPGDLTPVFDAMLEKAMRLCGASFGILRTFAGGHFHGAASRGVPPVYAEFLAHNPQQPEPGTIGGRIVADEPLVHVIDVADDAVYGAASADPHRRALVELGGARTSLVVPLRKDRTLLGAIQLYRQHVQAFSNKQIALLQNFAAQAVIAMENARLITETREALEQQTATAEVLGVINASPGDLAPVFEVILEKAHAVCGAPQGAMFLYDGERYRAVAIRGLSGPWAERLREGFGGSETGLGQPLVAGERFVQIADAAVADHPTTRTSAEVTGTGTLLSVPLRQGDALLGMIVAGRFEVRPFTDKQIALLQNFAAQAVIAMENARLLAETRERTRDLQESLEYQTATSDVLKVISQSTFDLQPVLDTVIETAVRLCVGDMATLFQREGDLYRAVAWFGNTPEYDAEIEKTGLVQAHRGTLFGRAVIDKQVIHIHDYAAAEPELTGPGRTLGRVRSVISVPMLRQGEPVGAISLGRFRVEPFTERQIELVRTFGDQAVIAIENARLLTELRERTRDLQESLEYQTATSDVLKVISGSVFDLAPVLQTVVTTAIRLCRADQAVIYRNIDGEYRWAASDSLSPAYDNIEREVRIRPGAGTLVGRAALEAQTIHILDCLADPLYEAKADARVGGIRTMLGVPLLREGEPIGVIGLARQRVEAFTDKETALVTTFADQAVIAIENARLLTELRERTRDLEESLEYQTATSNVLQVISRSTFDLQPVLDTLVKTAARLCNAGMAGLLTRDGDIFRVQADFGVSPEWSAMTRARTWRPGRDTTVGRTLLERAVVHAADVTTEPGYAVPEAVTVGKVRTALGVPLLRQGEPIGAILLARQRVEPFSERQIELVRTFADQAVIAIENSRLLTELRESLEQQQAMAEVLGVINSSPGNLQPVFDAMLERAIRLCGATQGVLWTIDGERVKVSASRQIAAEFVEVLRRVERGEQPPPPPLRRVMDGEHLIHIADLAENELYRDGHPVARAALERGLVRTLVWVALVKDGTAVGAFAIARREVQPFTDKQIALLQSFAAQAVIAMDNGRLLGEIRAARDAAENALGELRATQQQLVVQQKMAALGQLTAGIAHEIKNPLNFVNNFAGLSVELLDELKGAAAPGFATLGDEARAEIDETIELLTANLDKIAEHGRRADGIVKSMLAHSRGGSGEWQEVDLNAVVDEALNLAYHGARAQDQNFNITMERDFDPALAPIAVVPQDVTRVFLNLVGNGFYAANKRRAAADSGFRPMLKVATRDLGEMVEVRVRDNGTGISAAHRERLFQPFFTTKPTGEGTGLGLSISHDIVTHQHGGSIAVDSEEGAFTEFIVRLPRRRSPGDQGRTA